MANFSTWSRGVPSGASLLREFDDLYRSDKSILENALNDEHYFTSSSATSAGVHRHGSARIYMGTRSQLSTPTNGDGRLMYCSDTSSLHVIGASSSTTIASPSLADGRYLLASRATLGGHLVASSGTSPWRDGLLIGDGSGWRFPFVTSSGTTLGYISDTGILSADTLALTAGHTVWHSGNDGEASTLDADMLDGAHASAFAVVDHSHDERYYTETEVDALIDGMWTSSNDGSGSGLDADTVDGLDVLSGQAAMSVQTLTAAGGVGGVYIGVTGAAVGDAVAFGIDLGVTGVIVTPHVASANSVRLSFYNPGLQAVLSAQTVTAVVFKP